jgi:hypothetical protein
MLVYNTTIAIDEHAIDQLSFVSQLSQSIVVKQGNSPLANIQPFQHIFPSLYWVIRDFSLDLAEHKSPTDYLLHCLKPLPNDWTAKTMEKNMTRDAISKMFSSLHCVTMAHPGVLPEQMKVLDQLPYEALSSEFRSDCDKVVRLILSSVRPKLLMDPSSPTNCSSSINVSPASLLVYGESIFEAFNSDGIPRLDDMFGSTSRRTCQEAVDRAKSQKFDAVLRDLSPAKNISRSSWNPSIRLADHLQPLSEIQVNEVVEATQSEAIALFSSLALGPFLEPSQEQLQQLISEEVAKFRAANTLSRTLSHSVAAVLLSHLQSQVDQGTFASFYAYRAAQAPLRDLFEEVSPLLGPACGEVALEYMNQCEALREKMRLEFRLRSAERDRLVGNSSGRREGKSSAQELKVMDEQMQR